MILGQFARLINNEQVPDSNWCEDQTTNEYLIYILSVVCLPDVIELLISVVRPKIK